MRLQKGKTAFAAAMAFILGVASFAVMGDGAGLTRRIALSSTHARVLQTEEEEPPASSSELPLSSCLTCVEHQGRLFAVAPYLYMGDVNYTRSVSGLPPMNEEYLKDYILWIARGGVFSDFALSDADEWGAVPEDQGRRRLMDATLTTGNKDTKDSSLLLVKALTERVTELEAQVVKQNARLLDNKSWCNLCHPRSSLWKLDPLSPQTLIENRARDSR